MIYLRKTSLSLKFFIIVSLCLTGIVFMRGGNVHAAPVIDKIPAGVMPQFIEDYLLNCGYTNNAAAQTGWLSLAGRPTEVVTTVNYGTPTINLQYNVAGIVCRSSGMGGLVATNNGIMSTIPANLGLAGSTLSYAYGGSTGDYSITPRVFTFVQTGTFTTDTVVTVSLVEKRINVYSVNPRNRCVTNAGDVNPRPPNSGTDYGACISRANPVFSVLVNVVQPAPIVSCTITGATIFVGQSYTPSTDVTHGGPVGAPSVTLGGSITVQNQPADSVSGSVANGATKTLSAPARVYNAAGSFNVRVNLTATSSRPTVTFSCETTLIVKLPPPEIKCTVNSPSILAGDSTTLALSITHIGPLNAPAVSYNAVVSIATKPNQTFTGNINNGGSADITTANLPYAAGIYPVHVQVGGTASTACDGSISALNRPYLRTYSNDVMSGFGFYDSTSTCPSTAGNVTAFGRGPAQSFAGSGGQLGTFANGQINGFRSASTLGSATNLPALLSFANTSLVNTAVGLYGGNFGSGICMYNYWASSTRATPLATQNINIGTLASGSYYIRQLTPTPVTISGQIANGRKIVMYIEGTALLRGAAVGYNSTAWTAKTDIPSLYIIARGNIAVGSDVRNLDGHYIAQKSSATDGRIVSCADPATGQAYAAAAALIANCSNKLVINGSFNAEHVNLLRTLNSVSQATPGEPAATSNAAEVFVYPIETYISSQNVDNTRQQTYDSITALPPSL